MLMSLGLFFGGTDLLKDLSRLVVTAAGGWFALRGQISPGTLVAFLFYSNLILEPVDRLTRTVEATQRMAAGLKNFFEILDQEPAVRDRPGALPLEKPTGSIAFEDVTFGYARGRHVFRGLTAAMAPGSTVALVGPSGAGKTTFCSLIPRFYEPLEGRVLLDGRDVREYRPVGPAEGRRNRPAGRLPLPRKRAGEHTLRPPRCRGSRARGGGPERERPRPSWACPRDTTRTSARRGSSSRGPETEAVHSPGLPQGSRGTDPGRGRPAPWT
ncbi:MAG: ABC transporter ATP-binding protein/permease [Desulfobacterales bacterium]|nr:ABC transporter ATP-binding protein/permease [Desulfobacterales bacterium]